MLPASHCVIGSQKIVRPIAKPMKPSTCGLLEPVRDGRLVGAGAEDDAAHLIAAVGAGGVGDQPVVVGPGHALDLPHVGLDAGGVELLDRGLDELGRVRAAAPRLGLGRDEQLEQVLRLARGEPVRQLREPGGLPAVQLGVALGVVADEDLDEVRLERLDVLAERSPYSKSNSGCELFSAARASGRPLALASRAAARRSPRRSARRARCGRQCRRRQAGPGR